MTPAAVAAVLTLAAVEAEDTWVVTLLRVAYARDFIGCVARLVVDVVVALALELCRTGRTRSTCCKLFFFFFLLQTCNRLCADDGENKLFISFTVDLVRLMREQGGRGIGSQRDVT